MTPADHATPLDYRARRDPFVYLFVLPLVGIPLCTLAWHVWGWLA